MKIYSLGTTVSMILVFMLSSSNETHAQEQERRIKHIEVAIKRLQIDIAEFVAVYDDAQSAKSLTDAGKRLSLAFNRNKSPQESQDELQDVIDVDKSIREAIRRCYKAYISRTQCRYAGKIGAAHAKVESTVGILRREYKRALKGT